MPVEFEADYDAAVSSMDIYSEENVQIIHDWIQNLDRSKYVPKNLSKKQILIFYNACYGNIENTKSCIEKCYLYRKNAPEFFDNRVLSSPDIIPSLDALEFSFLPEKSVNGYDIIYHRLHNTEPSKYHLEIGVKLLFMTVDACLYKRGPQAGHIFLFDMRGVKLGHLSRVSLSSLRKFFQYVQEGQPVRMKAIHVLNSEPVLDKLLILIRPFMDKKLFEMIKFHSKNEDLEKFYETVVPRSALPPDHGGTLPDTQTLHKDCMNYLRSLEPIFQEEEKQRHACLDKKNGKDVVTSFKKLDID